MSVPESDDATFSACCASTAPSESGERCTIDCTASAIELGSTTRPKIMMTAMVAGKSAMTSQKAEPAAR